MNWTIKIILIDDYDLMGEMAATLNGIIIDLSAHVPLSTASRFPLIAHC